MKREIIQTADGSATISIPESGVTYHSRHGAIGESRHVFIEAGFRYQSGRLKRPDILRIFEMGFGTGLNALLTLIEATNTQQKIVYETIEAFPLEETIFSQLNYCDQLQQPGLKPIFEQLHTADWGTTIPITPFFTFKKSKTSLANFSIDQPVHLIYYDAFAPSAQPELWTTTTFEQLFNMLEAGGILTTYCSKADVRRAMQAAGFLIEKIPGPWGKREMVRARKN